jgi:hypothetical protein
MLRLVGDALGAYYCFKNEGGLVGKTVFQEAANVEGIKRCIIRQTRELGSVFELGLMALN